MAAALDAGWRASSAATLDDDLAQLWREVARDGPLSRAVMSNLVIVRPRGEGGNEPSDATVADVVRRHPARTIGIDYATGDMAVRPPDAVRINLLVFVSGTHRYGVERIVVSLCCAEDSIPSVVRRLARGDLPTTIWWTGDASRTRIPEPLTRIARQLVFDSAEWRDVKSGVAAVAAVAADRFSPEIADLNWRRLRPVRHAIRHVVRLPGGDPFDGALHIRVEHRPGSQALAWLLGGWLQRTQPRDQLSTLIVEERQSSHGAIASLFVEGAEARLIASLTETEVTVESTTMRTAVVMPSRRETTAEAVADELDSLGHEGALGATIAALHQHFGSQT